MSKIIFLDFDGVITTLKSNWAIDDKKVELVKEICDITGAKIDVCVMVLPCGRSANTEAGWMKGAGKRVMVYSPEKQEPELIYKIYDFVSDNIFRINDKIIGV